MGLKFNRNVSVSFNVEGEQIEMKLKVMTATEIIEYHNHVASIQESIEGEGEKRGAVEMFELMLDLLAKKVTYLHGVVDDVGDHIALPESFNDKKQMFDELGVEFISTAVRTYMEKIGKKAAEAEEQGKSQPS